ncbi:RagB/SusD family nutrient uptake outer membrane protein [Pinibacter soli]|uniref:RagB/SusD family nutrient uptake outer membrane protein n=1 Tax=Pinibacter soli TaxID=3044211 RepID=A0ABT6RF28_9BACT|nr:RagB/SusD family nutrient uptake outer membrane protein [Pinibacter soli]MDI3321174.1 RagB/SusD family nutrient uptake outer membrane protein [Pinibacter soli]
MKKNHLYICFIALAVITAACNKKLQEYNPSGTTSATVFNNAAGFETLVTAAYSYDRFWYGKEEGVSLSEMGTDIWTSGSGDVYPQLTQYNNLQGGNTASLNLEWDNFYAAINLCNTGIAGIAAVPDYTDAQKKMREGELRFLRAFYYWHIVETWGGVHFTTVPSAGAQTTANRTPIDSFYRQIFTDLNFAIANLPTTTSDYGRATLPVAKAFLARMYLTRGMNVQAAALANDVIKNYGFSLLPNYVDLWNMGNMGPGKNKEVIWAVDYSTNLSYNDMTTPTYPYGHSRGSNSDHLLYLMVYDQVNKSVLIRDINNGRPFNRYMPTLSYLRMFNRNFDSRYNGSFQSLWTCNQAGGSFKIGDTVCWATPDTIKDIATRKYTVYDATKVYKANGGFLQNLFYVSLSKFKDSTRASLAEAQSARDVFVIRLAEMYLIAAEAKYKQGDLDSAAYFINVVRKRAALPGHTNDMVITSAQVNLDFILDERARELGGEQLRWFDLKRTGKLVDRIKTQNLNPDAAVYVTLDDTLRPIPQKQLDAVTNKSEFYQNKGYN